jgi:hypothetical protein
MNLETNNDVLVNKSRTITSNEIYTNIKTTQILEIFNIATSFIVSSIFLRIIDDLIFNYYKKYNFLYFIILSVMFVIIILITSSLFTYSKIINDKDNFIKKIINED